MSARLAAPVSWMALIFWSSSRAWPGAESGVASWLPTWLTHQVPIDKLVHAGIYAVMAALWLWALHARRPWLAWLIPLVFGGFDELHQSTVPGRSADARDLLADAVGATLALGLWWVFRTASRRAKVR